MWCDMLTDIVSEQQPVAKKVAKLSGAEDFNVLQNNGSIAHQVVPHVRIPLLSMYVYQING